MKTPTLLIFAAIQFSAFAQTAAPAAPAKAEDHKLSALTPEPRTGKIEWRQTQVLQSAKKAPGDYDIEFIGDSITQRWDTVGVNVWREYYGQRKVMNMGVSGDCIENVLWRIEHGQLEGIHAKVAVLMIGTNNSRNNQDGTPMYPDADILAGITKIVTEIGTRQPDTKVLLLGIFPRAKTFDPQRGRLLQINQALSKLDDGQRIHYLDLGPSFIEKDGSISQEVMPDALHPAEAGYLIWAAAMEPKLKEMLQEK